MRKINSQLSIAIVCAILGFMLAYQFKAIINKNKALNITKENRDITFEIEQYKTQKKELEKKVNELQKKVKNYEDAVAGKSDQTKSLYEELQNTKIIIGTTDVHGEGIVLYLDSETMFNSANESSITNRDLVYLVNELRFAGAEAIAINDIRVTGSTGIRNASNYILVNDEKVAPGKRITIKAIGNKELLYQALGFKGVFDNLENVCEIKYEKVDDIKIKRYNKTYKFEYAKPVDNEEK